MKQLVARVSEKDALCWLISRDGEYIGAVMMAPGGYRWSRGMGWVAVIGSTRDEAALALARACGITDAIAPEVWP